MSSDVAHDACFAVWGDIQEFQTFTAHPFGTMTQSFPMYPNPSASPVHLHSNGLCQELFIYPPPKHPYTTCLTQSNDSHQRHQREEFCRSSNLTVHLYSPMVAQRDRVSPTTLPCANSREIDARSAISVTQHSFVAYLRNIQARNKPGVARLGPCSTSKSALTTSSGQHLLNLIIATSLWEQGLDFPQCSFMCWFDIRPHSLHISSHNHLLSNHLDSKLVLMLEVRDTLDHAQ